MLIKLKLGELKNAEVTIGKVMQAEMPVSKAYKLSKLLTFITIELTKFEEFRNKLITKYGETNEEGNIQVSQDNMQVFFNEMNDLLNENISFEFDKFKLEELEAMDSLKLSPVDIKSIEFMIEV